MGYQESYVTTRSEKDFSGLCEYIKSIGRDVYDTYGAMPVEIITLENLKRAVDLAHELRRKKIKYVGMVR